MALTIADKTIGEGVTSLLRGQLLDTLGVPIDPADLDAIKLTLFDSNTAGIINSRSAQDVNGANNGTVKANLTISGATQTNPVVITTTANHGLLTGERVKIKSVVGMTQINDRAFNIIVLTATTFALQDENGLEHTAYSSAGTVISGVFEMEFQPADNIIVSTTLTAPGKERHIALFEFTYLTDKEGKTDVRIDIQQNRKVT